MWIVDLDGVVWLMDALIEGSDRAVALLRSRGKTIRFVTNNSTKTATQYVEKFAKLGIKIDEQEMVTSSMAAASLLNDSDLVYVVGTEALRNEVAKVATVLSEEDADSRSSGATAVVVGWDGRFSFDKLRIAQWSILGGARLIATNADPTYPTPEGLIPGAGSMVAPIEVAAGVKAVVAGKPFGAISKLLGETLEPDTVAVGDRYTTDGAFAKTLGIPFYYVKSGIAEERPEWVPEPDLVGASFLDIVRTILGD